MGHQDPEFSSKGLAPLELANECGDTTFILDGADVGETNAAELTGAVDDRTWGRYVGLGPFLGGQHCSG